MFKTRLDTFGNDFGLFWILKIFAFSKTFRRLDPTWNTGQKNFSKKVPKNMFKTLLDILGTILGVFGILNFFNFFNNISKTRPSMEHWAKKLFEKVNPTLVQNTFAHFWERFWAIMEVWKIFHFLKTFRRLDTPWNTGQKNFSEKLPQNMFKTRLDTFGNDFVQLWNFEKFLIFWKHFEDSTIHGTLGKNFFRKNSPKTCSKHVWTIWERFWAFLEIWKIFSFFTKTFRRLDTPWNIGQKIFSKKLPRKHVQNTFGRFLGTIFGIFGNLKFFWFFENISKTRPSMEHWAKKLFGKITSKHVQNTFGHFWERFCAIMKFWKKFWFFENISKTRPSMEHWAKFFFGKITPKLVQNTFGQFGNDFGHFWKFEKFLVFLQRHFEDSTLHGTLGKKFFRKNYRENMFKTRLDGFWERFSAFLEIWNFFDFLKTFRRLDPPWNTGQKKISKKVPQNMFKTRLRTFGNDFWDFWNF